MFHAQLADGAPTTFYIHLKPERYQHTVICFDLRKACSTVCGKTIVQGNPSITLSTGILAHQ